MNLVINLIAAIARFISVFICCIPMTCLHCMSNCFKRVFRKKRVLRGRKIADFLHCYSDPGQSVQRTRSILVTAIKYCEPIEVKALWNSNEQNKKQKLMNLKLCKSSLSFYGNLLESSIDEIYRFFDNRQKCVNDCEKGHNLMKYVTIDESLANRIELLVDESGFIYECWIDKKRMNGESECLFQPFDILLLNSDGSIAVTAGRLTKLTLSPGKYCIFSVFNFMIRITMTDDMLIGDLAMNVCLIILCTIVFCFLFFKIWYCAL